MSQRKTPDRVFEGKADALAGASGAVAGRTVREVVCDGGLEIWVTGPALVACADDPARAPAHLLVPEPDPRS
ncbi:hypothetical protein [Saccharopolyspora sp. 6M]|uniref:hypothetical protein n=1 Tax=Saccharopolyspora sp. 6M TaxID=2877237 RepID=UPI001CD19679|nr:hypothetical protein [Saccharopolyspora sp. 6M]MCA1229685.1 hypothetical protein [Saccharopolyspora sp. 6M]